MYSIGVTDIQGLTWLCFLKQTVLNSSCNLIFMFVLSSFISLFKTIFSHCLLDPWYCHFTQHSALELFCAWCIYAFFDCFGCKLSPNFLMHFVLLAEQPYDSIPNFSAADALRLTGIGRNEFIDIMNKCRSKVVDKCTYMLLDIDNIFFFFFLIGKRAKDILKIQLKRQLNNILFSSYACIYGILLALET